MRDSFFQDKQKTKDFVVTESVVRIMLFALLDGVCQSVFRGRMVVILFEFFG